MEQLAIVLLRLSLFLEPLPEEFCSRVETGRLGDSENEKKVVVHGVTIEID